MLEELKQRVLDANLLLPKYGLITFTWGNVSEIDREKGIVAIKPSGVEYDVMTRDDIVLVDLDGNIVEGNLRPSSDLDTHLGFYRNFPNIEVLFIHIPLGQRVFAQAGKRYHSIRNYTGRLLSWSCSLYSFDDGRRNSWRL